MSGRGLRRARARCARRSASFCFVLRRFAPFLSAPREDGPWSFTPRDPSPAQDSPMAPQPSRARGPSCGTPGVVAESRAPRGGSVAVSASFCVVSRRFPEGATRRRFRGRRVDGHLQSRDRPRPCSREGIEMKTLARATPTTMASPPACPSTSWGRVASPTRGTAPWPGTSTATPTPSSRAAGSSMRLLEPRYTPSKRARGTAETDPRALRPAAAMQPNSGRPRVGGRAVGGERSALIEAATSEGVSADYRAVATSRARGLSAVPLQLAAARRRRGSVTTPVTAIASDP